MNVQIAQGTLAATIFQSGQLGGAVLALLLSADLPVTSCHMGIKLSKQNLLSVWDNTVYLNPHCSRITEYVERNHQSWGNVGQWLTASWQVRYCSLHALQLGLFFIKTLVVPTWAHALPSFCFEAKVWVIRHHIFLEKPPVLFLLVKFIFLFFYFATWHQWWPALKAALCCQIHGCVV